MVNEYDELSRFYDQEFGDRSDDLAFMRDRALDKRRILHPGVGTGRLLAALLEGGAEVWGLDRSEGMLSRAHERVKQMPKEIQDKVHLQLGDMSEFTCPGPFDLVVLSENTFSELLEQSTQIATLSCFRRHLVPKGELILPLASPQGMSYTPVDGVCIHKYSRPLEDGRRLDRFSTRRVDPVEQMLSTTMIFDVSDAERLVRHCFEMRQRYFCHTEVELLLRITGFELVKCAGSYRGEPLRWGSYSMVFECVRT